MIPICAVHELGLYGGLTFSILLTTLRQGVYQVRVGNVYLAEVCARGAGGVGHSDRVTLTKALLNSDQVRPLKLVRKGIASEADSDLIKSN